MIDNNFEFNNTKVITSFIWKMLERSGTQGIQFIVQIVLARLLLPEQFGTVAIVMVFISLANVFVQSGFSTALIQKKNADEVDFSSIFYVSLGLAGLLYIIIYLTAPGISNFYSDPMLVPVLRVLSFVLFPGALNSVQNAYVSKKFMFKKLFISSLGAVLISGVVGILAAYNGLGIWALVFQQLANQIFVSLIMWFTVKWRPRLSFSFSRVKILFSFGWKLLVSSLINILYMDVRTLIIGRIYSASTLGFYNRGEQFPKLIVKNVDGSIQSVMLPTLSAFQDNKVRLKEIMRRAIVTSSFLVFPIMVGMFVVAEPLVKIVLTEKWLPAVPFLRIFSVSYALMPIHSANLQAINAIGRSDIFLKLEIIKKIVGTLILFISVPFGIYSIAFGMVVNGVISSFVNAYPNQKLLDYSYIEQIKDIIPSLAISLFMGGIVYIINFLNINVWQVLILQICLGTVIYFGLARIFKLESFRYLQTTIKHMLARNTSK